MLSLLIPDWDSSRRLFCSTSWEPAPPPFLFLFLGQSCLSNNLAPSPPPSSAGLSYSRRPKACLRQTLGTLERRVCLGRMENPSLGEGPRKFLLREFFPDLDSPPPPRKQSSIFPVAFEVALALLATSIQDWDPGRVTGGQRGGWGAGEGGGPGAAGSPALSQSHFKMSSVLYIQK